MARFCDHCGNPVDAGTKFCGKCGSMIKAPADQPKPPVPPSPPAYTPPPPAYAPPPVNAYRQQPVYAAPPKKSRAGLIAGLIIGALVLVGLLVGGGIVVASLIANPVSTPSVKNTPKPNKPAVELLAFPKELTIDENNVKVNCSYRFPDRIIPANYRSLDYVVYMQCWTDRGRANVLVSVEIPGFTQKYEQMIEVSRSETELVIHPPLLEGVAKTLVTAKDAQLLVTVKDTDNGKIWRQDTKEIKLWSFYDMQWVGEDGTPYYENILAWVTPQAEEIDRLIYDAGNMCNVESQGRVSTIAGYQGASENISGAEITFWQVYSMMKTLAATYGVKYSNNSFSSTGSAVQSVATPAKVINNAAGLCIETSVTLASAVQRTSMHAVIILLPGHAQVAVETYSNSGEYLLVETTALDGFRTGTVEEIDGNIIQLLNKEQWTEYLSQDGYVAIDCDLAEQLKILPID